MARLERISFTPCAAEKHNTVKAGEIFSGRARKLPQIFWVDSSPCREVNLWALERTNEKGVSPGTVSSSLCGLLNYANYLERNNLHWFAFPLVKAERCLMRYRGWLIDERDAGRLAPSTVTQYMRYVVTFYRWVLEHNLLQGENDLWCERGIYQRVFNAEGFARSLRFGALDVAIPNRRRPGEQLEDGLLPISSDDRELLLDFCRASASEELYLMLSVGFMTGMRVGTICDLKIATLENAVVDPATSDLYKLSVGPGANPPVFTKFGVTGSVWIPAALRDVLLDYAMSLRRSKRQAKARVIDRGVLFLTRYGNRYCRKNTEESSAINTEMRRLRQAGRLAGIRVLDSFHFHQSRCTFATELAAIAMKAGDEINAIAFVMLALLHKNEATAFKYIKFLRTFPLKVAAANSFTRVFLGIHHAVRRVS